MVGVGVDEIGSGVGVEVVVIGVAVESATVVDVDAVDDDVVVLPSTLPVVVEPAMAVVEVVAAGVAVESATVVDVNALDDDVVVLAFSCPQMLGIHDRAIKTARVTTTDRLGRVRRSPGRDACAGRPVCMQSCGSPSRVSGHKLACLLRAEVEHHADARAITTLCAPRSSAPAEQRRQLPSPAGHLATGCRSGSPTAALQSLTHRISLISPP
jgi:hypothetical protein